MKQYLSIFGGLFEVAGIGISLSGEDEDAFVETGTDKAIKGIIRYCCDTDQSEGLDLNHGYKDDFASTYKLIYHSSDRSVYYSLGEFIVKNHTGYRGSVNLFSFFNLIGIDWFVRDNGGIVLHSSFVEYNGRGYLFAAPCGTGKSTHADLWVKHFNARILNGDRTAILFQKEKIMAYGMPYAGSSQIYRNEGVPLAAITVIRQGQINQIRKLSPAEALPYLYPEVTGNRKDAEFMTYVLDRLIELTNSVPIYYLECKPDAEAALLARDTMTD